jgi:predicted alpha/beta hydrolase family esterase
MEKDPIPIPVEQVLSLYDTAQKIGYPMSLEKAFTNTANSVWAEKQEPDLKELKKRHEPVTSFLRSKEDPFVSIDHLKQFGSSVRQSLNQSQATLSQEAWNAEIFRQWTVAVRAHAEAQGYKDSYTVSH